MAKAESSKNKKNVVSKLSSAEKRNKQAEKRRDRNVARKSAIKTAIKKVHSALEANDVMTAKELLRDVQAQLSRARGKGTLHRNTAARKMSRLAKRVAQVEKPAAA